MPNLRVTPELLMIQKVSWTRFCDLSPLQTGVMFVLDAKQVEFARSTHCSKSPPSLYTRKFALVP